MTGLGQVLIGAIVGLSNGYLIIALVLTMLCCIVLGMGVPTTANYIIMATTCAPILASGMGLDLMAAHMFCFYFGIVADITPPVALAAYAGSAIAKGDPFKTGVIATRIAIGAFIVPYIFVLNPVMLMIDATVWDILLSALTALLGMYALSGGLTGFVEDHCTWYERLILIAGGLAMIVPGLLTDVVGLVLLAAIILVQKARVKKRALEG